MESDRIVHVLTSRHGLVGAIAKGALRSRRRFPGALEPFSEVRLDMFQGRASQLHRIEQAVLVDAHMELRQDLVLMGHAAVLLDMAKEHLGPLDPAPLVYACLKDALSGLSGTRQWFASWCSYLMDMLGLLGYGIDLSGAGNSGGRGAPEGTLSGQARAFLDSAPRLGRDALARVVLGEEVKREIRIFLLERCGRVSLRPLRTVMFLAKLLDLDIEQCYMI